MTTTFSERQGIVRPFLKKDEMPIELRNRLWNVIKKYIDTLSKPLQECIIENIWDGFFKNPLDKLEPYFTSYQHPIKQLFYALTCYKVYEFIEFLLRRAVLTPYIKNFTEDINSVFLDAKAPYQIIDKMVTPLISEEETAEIEKALQNDKYDIARIHIRKAIESYRARPAANYLESIKESIHALEALARIILNKPSAKLSDLINSFNIHPAFKKGLDNLYGWTSDEGGIRHANKELNNEILPSTEPEARLMVVQCSALLNYIISTHATPRT